MGEMECAAREQSRAAPAKTPAVLALRGGAAESYNRFASTLIEFTEEEVMTEQGAPAQAQNAANRAVLENERRKGIGWFYWISGLSIVNSLIIHFGSDRSFVVGLGLTRLIDYRVDLPLRGMPFLFRLFNPIIFSYRLLERNLIRFDISPDTTRLFASVLIGAVFILFGVLGNKNRVWAIFVGLGIYALDTLILFAVGDYLSTVFHVFVLVMLFGGLRAALALARQAAPA
jgi:hypothetical protein